MAIEKLLQQIRQQTAEKISQILAQAQQEAAQILARAEEKLAQQRRQEISRIDRQVKEYEESLVSPVRLKANQLLLEVKQKLLEELLNEIPKIWEKQPIKFKQELYRRWLKNYSGGELTISAKEKNIWTNDFLQEINRGGKKFKLIDAADKFHFGFRLSGEKWEVDFSSEALQEIFREKARLWVNREWFNG